MTPSTTSFGSSRYTPSSASEVSNMRFTVMSCTRRGAPLSPRPSDLTKPQTEFLICTSKVRVAKPTRALHIVDTPSNRAIPGRKTNLSKKHAATARAVTTTQNPSDTPAADNGPVATDASTGRQSNKASTTATPTAVNAPVRSVASVLATRVERRFRPDSETAARCLPKRLPGRAAVDRWSAAMNGLAPCGKPESDRYASSDELLISMKAGLRRSSLFRTPVGPKLLRNQK